MSNDGSAFVPHLDSCFLLVGEFERLVFTNAVDSGWRPANSAPTEVTMSDHPDGTDYRIVARHGDPKSRNRHAELGFDAGWGTVADQLTQLAKACDRHCASSQRAPTYLIARCAAVPAARR